MQQAVDGNRTLVLASPAGTSPNSRAAHHSPSLRGYEPRITQNMQTGRAEKYTDQVMRIATCAPAAIAQQNPVLLCTVETVSTVMVKLCS